LREQNFESLKRAGIISADSSLPPRNPAIEPFASLSAEEQRRESRKMELYAAMVDNLDRHVGRLLDYLRANDLYDDTLIIFMSDNGAGIDDAETRTLWERITCPVLLIRGADSWAKDPHELGIPAHFRNAEFVTMEGASHWVHHDRLDEFLRLAREFLAR
jgi:arylsulfatase A-like enzyme